MSDPNNEDSVGDFDDDLDRALPTFGSPQHEKKARVALAVISGEELAIGRHLSEATLKRTAEHAALNFELRRLDQLVDRVLALVAARETSTDEQISRLRTEAKEARELASDMRAALLEIRDHDWVANCLDPHWAARRAAAVIGRLPPRVRE